MYPIRLNLQILRFTRLKKYLYFIIKKIGLYTLKF